MKVEIDLRTLRDLYQAGRQNLDDEEAARLAMAVLEARKAHRRPPWHTVAEGYRQVRKEVLDLDPGMVASVDNGSAAMRDTLDLFGIDVTDEWHVYVFLVTCQMLAHSTQYGHRAGTLSDPSYASMMNLIRALTTSVELPADV